MTNEESNNVSVIATASNTVVATVAVGRFPIAVAVGPAPAGIPFLAFSAKLEISENSFELNSSFTLKSTASIDPSTEPVTLSVGTFTTTIPPGSFKQDKDGDKFTFEGTINGVRLEALIELTGTLRYVQGGGGKRESGRDKKPGSGQSHHRRRQRHNQGQGRVRRQICRTRRLSPTRLQASAPGSPSVIVPA